MHNATFIYDLTLVVLAASVAAILFKLIRLPALLGYLCAGLIIGPNFFEHPLINDRDVIADISELGVIFLMFYIGLEFEINKLKKVLAPAFLAITLQTVLMLFIGSMIAPLMGRGAVEGLFLGGMLAISSSMVTIQVLRERQLLDYPHAQLAVGILILEDVLAIILLVLLSGVAVSGHFQWAQAWQATFLIGIFVLIVYIAGRVLSAPLLKLMHRFGSMDLIALVTVAVALGVGGLAAQFNFSVALGAFLAGAILSESSLAEDIEKNTLPLRALFVAIFFVSVGMTIDPWALLNQWKWILAIAAFVMFGKVITCSVGLFLMGQHPRSSVRAAFSKAQIGEFSFVIAALGKELGVIDASLQAMITGVALVTIVLTYPMGAMAPPLYFTVRDRMPRGLLLPFHFYLSLVRTSRNRMDKSRLWALGKKPVLSIVAYFFLFSGIVIVSTLLAQELEAHGVGTLFLWVLWGGAALLSVVPIISMAKYLDACGMILLELLLEGRASHEAEYKLKTVLYPLLMLVVIVLFSGVLLSAASPFLPGGLPLILFALMTLLASGLLWTRLIKLNHRVEAMFFDSFNAGAKSMEANQRAETRKNIEQKYPWPVKLREVEIPEASKAAGKRIRELLLRDHSAAMILAICRGSHTHFDPGPDVPLFPHDRVILLGEEAEADKAEQYFNERMQDSHKFQDDEPFQIIELRLSEQTPLDGDTLAGANLRRRFHVSVVGIQKGDKRILSPSPSEILHAGDHLLLAGKSAAINDFIKDAGCDSPDFSQLS